MLAYRRRQTILEWLATGRPLTVRQAAGQLHVSEVTIRSDLRALERQGAVMRVHGGAILTHPESPPRMEPHIERQTGESHRFFVLAQRAAAMVEDGEAIVITAGPTDSVLARALAARRHLTIVTNSLDVARLLAMEPTNTVIVVGGTAQPSGAVVVDPGDLTRWAHVPPPCVRAFVNARWFSPALGVLTESDADVATLRALTGLADQTIVLVSDDDVSGQALVCAMSMSEINHVIMDAHMSANAGDILQQRGVTVSWCGNTVVTVPPLHPAQQTYRVGFANLSETEVFTAEVRRSIEDAARRAGNIELLLADNNYDGETALRHAEAFIAQGVHLVIEYQTDERFGYRLMHRLRLAHIPVIAIDIPHPGATYFGVDNYTAGHIGGVALGREIGRRWQGQLDHVIVLGLPRSGPSVAARLQGQIDAISEVVTLKSEMMTWLDSENVYSVAYRKTREVLGNLPVGSHLAVVAINDATMRGAIAALEETGHAQQTVAVSLGADRLALEELQRPGSPLIGAVVFGPETYGQRLIALVQDILAGKKVPPAVYQQHWLIGAGTLDRDVAERPPVIKAMSLSAQQSVPQPRHPRSAPHPLSPGTSPTAVGPRPQWMTAPGPRRARGEPADCGSSATHGDPRAGDPCVGGEELLPSPAHR